MSLARRHPHYYCPSLILRPAATDTHHDAARRKNGVHHKEARG